MAHLSLKACIDPAGHLQSNGFSEVGTLSPGQMPKNCCEMYIDCYESCPTLSKLYKRKEPFENDCIYLWIMKTVLLQKGHLH